MCRVLLICEKKEEEEEEVNLEVQWSSFDVKLKQGGGNEQVKVENKHGSKTLVKQRVEIIARRWPARASQLLRYSSC